MSELSADIVIIGSGITGALVAEWLSEHTKASILMVEAGEESPPSDRYSNRRRYLDYQEWPWPNTEIKSLKQRGAHAWPSHMLLGGMATHWGAQTPRYRPECFKLHSLFGVSEDWPISYEDLEPWYTEAEYRIGVSGDSEHRQLAFRSKPYPMPPMPLNCNLARIKSWAAEAGIETFPRPFAINSRPYQGRAECMRFDTCRVCPSGAKFSPDHLVRKLVTENRIQLAKNSLVTRLETSENGERIVRAHAVTGQPPHSSSVINGKHFVLAGGTVWTSYLLLLSANSRFPEGLANRSGLVGKYIVGHHLYSQYFRIEPRLIPEIHLRAALTTEQFMLRSHSDAPARWDMTLMAIPNANPVGRWGDELLKQLREENQHGTVGCFSFRESIPHAESGVRLSTREKTAWGDPLPQVDLKDRGFLGGERVNQALEKLGERLADVGLGRARPSQSRKTFDHRSGGCRMGNNPNSSVCDTEGRSHDHENLYVVGAPLCITGGTTNSTLTFSALALRTANAIAKQS